MMGRQGSSSTVNAAETGVFLATFALAKAMADGRERAAALHAVDRAHSVGQSIVMKGRLQRRAADLEVAAVAKERLLTNRARLHG